MVEPKNEKVVKSSSLLRFFLRSMLFLFMLFSRDNMGTNWSKSGIYTRKMENSKSGFLVKKKNESEIL